MKHILILAIAIGIPCLSFFIEALITQPATPKKQELQAQIDSLTIVIQSREDEIDWLENELQMKESEISYWGHKYDSIANKPY